MARLQIIKLTIKLTLLTASLCGLCACPGKRRAPRPTSDEEPQRCTRVGQRCTLSEGRSKSATLGVCSPGGLGEGLSCVPQH